MRLALSGSQINIAGLHSGGVGSRELHNTLLHMLGPAIFRDLTLFSEIACDILRIVIRREDENSLGTVLVCDAPTLIVFKREPIAQPLGTGQEQPQSRKSSH